MGRTRQVRVSGRLNLGRRVRRTMRQTAQLYPSDKFILPRITPLFCGTALRPLPLVLRCAGLDKDQAGIALIGATLGQLQIIWKASAGDDAIVSVGCPRKKSRVRHGNLCAFSVPLCLCGENEPSDKGATRVRWSRESSGIARRLPARE